mgnify:CR=1 FL=1
MAAIIIATFMSAIEGTIVATAMPNIVSEIGGFSLYSWVFSSYLIMQAVSILIYGKLADLYGRKPVFLFGLGVFLIGSILCGFASSIIMLIIFRFIQGLGAGAVTPIANTIVGDLYSLEERGKVQGYLSSVWGISAVLGPVIGGFFVEYASWSMIFWLNIPIGFMTIAGIVFFLHENVEKKEQKIDYAGCCLFLIAVLTLMVILIQGGNEWDWTSVEILCLSSVSLLFFLLFFYHQLRQDEPMFPLSLWKSRVFFNANVATLTSGMIMIGVASFLPTFVQAVMDQSPIVAGFTLTTMSIGWPIASTIAGKLIVKVNYRILSLAGGGFLLVGSLLFILLKPAYGPWWAAAASFFVGAGMGLISTTFIVVIQNIVSWDMRGFATANHMFMRLLGSAVGAAVLGGVLNSQMKLYFLSQDQPVDKTILANISTILMNDADRNAFHPAFIHLLEEGLIYGLHSVYICFFIIALITLLFIILLPKKLKEFRLQK